MSIEIPRGKMVVYGAGGCGINLTSHYLSSLGHDLKACAAIEPYFADTSVANIPADVPDDRVYIVSEGSEGAGKIRTENRAEIAKAVRPVLQKFTPGDLNLVIFSASGGSGSVLGPHLVAKLLEDNKPVVALVVGGDECERAATNTLNTIKTLEGISQKTGKTVMMYYEHLKPTDKQSQIDNRIWFVVSALAHLVSRRNTALDLRDMANFFNFSAPVTSAAAQLSALEVYRNIQEANAASSFAIAVASLLPNPDAEGIAFRPEYLCVGYPQEPLPEKIESLHFVAGIEPIHGMFKNLAQASAEIAKAKHARIAHDAIVNSSETDADGFVF